MELYIDLATDSQNVMPTSKESNEIVIFVLEGKEILDRTEQLLVELEQDPSKQGIIDDLFRGIHTLKGNSGFMGYPNLEKLCHKSESVMARVRDKQLTMSGDLTTILLTAVDAIRDCLSTIEQVGTEPALHEKQEIMQQLTAVLEA